MTTMAHRSNNKGGGEPSRRTLEFPREYPIFAPDARVSGAVRGVRDRAGNGRAERLARFLSMLLACNEVVNLTAIKDQEPRGSGTSSTR